MRNSYRQLETLYVCIVRVHIEWYQQELLLNVFDVFAVRYVGLDKKWCRAGKVRNNCIKNHGQKIQLNFFSE